MMDLKVCIGSACHIKGSPAVIKIFKQLVEEYDLGEKVELKAVFCLGHCTEAVSVQISEGKIYSVQPNNAKKFFEECVLKEVN